MSKLVRELRAALEADTNAVIKLILTELDDVASLPPEQASEPYALDERKRRIKRRLWDHHRAYVRASQED
jgi:hypothetical protein